MADHHRHFRVHQALRHRRARAWVGDIVLGDQFELGHLVTDFQLLLVGLFYGNLNAMLDVLSLVRRRPVRGPAKPILTTSLSAAFAVPMAISNVTAVARLYALPCCYSCSAPSSDWTNLDIAYRMRNGRNAIALVR